MGAGRTLRRALAELERLPEDARERHVALPALLEYRLALLEQPTRTPEDEKFLMDTHDIVQQLKDEGRHEARQKDLMTIYRTRFGSVPRKVRAAVERKRSRERAALGERADNERPTGRSLDLAGRFISTSWPRTAGSSARPVASSSYLVRMEQNSVERLRQKLKAWAATHATFTVTDGRVQYVFDEDSEAFATVAVDDVTQRSSREGIPVLVVERSREPEFEMFFARVWLSYGAEMWFVDAKQHLVRVYTPAERHPRTARDGFDRGEPRMSLAPEATLVHDKLSSPVLPEFMLDVPTLFSDAPAE
jgi:hypothetical protein